MTNEKYLYISYVAAIILGLVLATVTLAILRRPHQEATIGAKVKKLASLMRRVFPSWLILTVLLAFISVSYIDCSHTNYVQVVADRGHLINKTQEQVSNMLTWLAIALFTYCFVLVLFLWARARAQYFPSRPGREKIKTSSIANPAPHGGHP